MIDISKGRIKWQPDKAWLKQKYLVEKMTLSEIGKESGVSVATVMRALIAVGISRREPNVRNNKRGQAHANWKGKKAKYSALHKRLYKILGKADHCRDCGDNGGEIVYNWANLTGKLDDPKDYAPMCRRCHMLYDNKKWKETSGHGFLWEKHNYPRRKNTCQPK